MPWADVTEPFSAPPRSVGPMGEPGESPVVELDDRWASILDAELTGPIDASGCDRLELRGSVLRGASFIAAPGLELDVTASAFVECDLSALRFTTLTGSRFEGCKLSGVDFGNGMVRDVLFERTIIRMTLVRMAALERVSFHECVLDDVDFSEATLDQVAFPRSALRNVELDRAAFTRVDLRDATELDLRSCRTFDGCLIELAQVTALAHLFAHAAGVSIARPSEP